MLPSVIEVVSQCPGDSFESLKHTLSSKIGRESLYVLPIERAVGIIDDLEQVSTK